MNNNPTRPITRKAKILILAMVAFVLGLDQVTKYFIEEYFAPGEILPVIGNYFNLTLTYNKGAAFGLFSNFSEFYRYFVLIVATSAAFIALIFFLIRDYRHDSVAQVGIAFIIGGALGNISDRVQFGHVIDFLDFYYGDYHWPAFNVADSAICVGVFLLIFRRPKHA